MTTQSDGGGSRWPRHSTPVWQVVLYDATQQKECWCGSRKGHAGWLICAEKEAERLDMLAFRWTA